MTESLVSTVRTTPTMREFAAALLAVWPDATKAQAGVLYAQFAGETGDGKSCWNRNLGNVKWSKGCGLDFVSLAGVWEGIPVRDEDGDGDVDADDRAMLEARMVASGLWAHDPNASHQAAVGKGKLSLIATRANATTYFRAYPTLAAGMASFVKMKQTGRFASAWAFVLEADCDGFAKDLGTPRVRAGDTFPTAYFTASVAAYAAAMKAKHAVWMASSAFDDASAELPPATAGDDQELVLEGDVVHPYVELEPPTVREV